MTRPMARTEILAKFHAMIARGEPIIGGGTGTGLSAKCEEAGGIDLIVIYISGRYRMAVSAADQSGRLCAHGFPG